MNSRWKLVTLFVSGLAAFAASGCVNLDPVADGTRFYVLADESAKPSEYSGDESRVGVRMAWTSDHLRKPGIVVREASHEISFAANHQWAGRLENSVLRALVQGMRKELPDVRVIPLAGVQTAPPEVVVESALISCEGTADGRAHLELTWRILAEGKMDRRAAGEFSGSKGGWTRGDFGQLASLLGALLEEAAAAMARDVGAAIARMGEDGANEASR